MFGASLTAEASAADSGQEHEFVVVERRTRKQPDVMQSFGQLIEFVSLTL